MIDQDKHQVYAGARQVLAHGLSNDSVPLRKTIFQYRCIGSDIHEYVG